MTSTLLCITPKLKWDADSRRLSFFDESAARQLEIIRKLEYISKREIEEESIKNVLVRQMNYRVKQAIHRPLKLLFKVA